MDPEAVAGDWSLAQLRGSMVFPDGGEGRGVVSGVFHILVLLPQREPVKHCTGVQINAGF